MGLTCRRSLLGLAFILLLSSAEGIRMRSTIDATKRLREHEAVGGRHAAKAVQSWTNSELIQLKGQVKSLSLHLAFLSDAVTEQNAEDIKSGVRKLTKEVHNCKEVFSRITEFGSDADSCPEDEFRPDCVSSDALDDLSDSIVSLFGDPFLDKITDNLVAFSLSKDSTVHEEVQQVRESIQVSDRHPDANDEDRGQMLRLNGCLSGLDKELTKETPSKQAMEEALANAPHAPAATVPYGHSKTNFLESGVMVHARQGQRTSGQLRLHQHRTAETPGSLLVKGIMTFFIGVPLLAFGMVLSMALVFVYAVIYSVAWFLGLKFVTDKMDQQITHTVGHALQKLNQAINWIVPQEGIKIGEIRRESPFMRKRL
jgi:hypothetical protein